MLFTKQLLKDISSQIISYMHEYPTPLRLMDCYIIILFFIQSYHLIYKFFKLYKVQPNIFFKK